ncbi:MAG: helix-turn-helix domain-containing protein [Limisphaera sp.]
MNPKSQRDIEEMKQRQREGMRLLARGLSRPEVAHRCGVSRGSMWRWEQQRHSGGAGA